jgi:hypothetical protein
MCCAVKGVTLRYGCQRRDITVKCVLSAINTENVGIGNLLTSNKYVEFITIM